MEEAFSGAKFKINYTAWGNNWRFPSQPFSFQLIGCLTVSSIERVKGLIFSLPPSACSTTLEPHNRSERTTCRATLEQATFRRKLAKICAQHVQKSSRL